jgi:hypothetical protein
MSLRDSYYNGPNGIQQQMDAAFANGIAYVGNGANDISTLSLGDRTGTNLAAGSGLSGLYFTYATPTANYVMWMYVSGEVAPAVAGNLVQVTLLSGDNATQVAAKIAAAMNSISGAPFSCMSSASVVQMVNNVSGVVILPVSAGTLGGTAAVAQAQAGVAPTGQYSALQTALQQAAAGGKQCFRVVTLGTGNMSASILRANNGNNLALRAFFAGVYQALAQQQIYDYQVWLQLDISTNAATNVIFNFDFAKKYGNAPVNMDSLTCPPGGASASSSQMSGCGCGCSGRGFY